jgi:hypothetical protein
MLHFAAGGIARHDVCSWDKISPQETTQRIDRICCALGVFVPGEDASKLEQL